MITPALEGATLSDGQLKMAAKVLRSMRLSKEAQLLSRLAKRRCDHWRQPRSGELDSEMRKVLAAKPAIIALQIVRAMKASIC